MGILIVSFVFSLGIVWAVSALARSQDWGKAGVCGFCLVATVPFVLCFSPALALQCLATVVLTLVCAAFRSKPGMVVLAAVGAMVVSYAIMIGMSLSELHNLARLREKYPVESLSSRLAYESRAGEAPPGAAAESRARHFSPEVELRLAKFDDGIHGHSNMRQYMLASLHSRSSDAFVVARGFGPVRMLGVHAERIELPEPGPIPLPAPPEQYVPDQQSSMPIADESAPDGRQANGEGLLAMHAAGLEDLFDSGRMGYVSDRDHVAGFLSHRFTKMPVLASQRGTPQSSWQVVRLELVSLLRNDFPMAYVSKNLPQMDKLDEIPTRALNDFERRCIDRLAADEDVVTDEAPDRIQMVGSLRAATSCLKCHSVQRGDLLGALTYELVPVNRSRIRAKAVRPPEL